jgi:hypothetical protein
LTIGLIVGSIIAAYAAIVSTLSLILSVRNYRASDPNVSLDWEYDEIGRRLSLSIWNTGRADVTIASANLYIVHERIVRRSPTGKYFAIQSETLDNIPTELWWLDLEPETFPIRLASNSLLTTQVKNNAISLPTGYPLEELLLRFVVKFPGGKDDAYLRGDVMRHFVGIDPDKPIAWPSPGNLPIQD